MSKMKKIQNLHEVLPKHTRVLDPHSHRMPHYNYPYDQMENIQIEDLKPKKVSDWLALYTVKFMRRFYDLFTKYDLKNMTERRWLNRAIFLESIAGVPGMCGGMCRHLRSVRGFKRDNGWIHHLLEEADNERFHLIIFLNLRKPGIMMRLMILAAQGVFMNAFFLTYLLNHRFCHRFTGYLQNEAVKTYTAMLQAIDTKQGILNHWNYKKAPEEAIKYYHFDQKNATFRDVILAIRTDQACHRATNHFFAQIQEDYDLEEENIKIPEEQAVKEEEDKNKPTYKGKYEQKAKKQNQKKID